MLCLLLYGDTALKSWFLPAFWAPKKWCGDDIFRAVFASIGVSWIPQTLQNKGKREMTNRPCFTPPPPQTPPLQKYLCRIPKNDLRGHCDIAATTLSIQLCKRAPRELFSRELRKFCEAQQGRVCCLNSHRSHKTFIIGDLMS